MSNYSTYGRIYCITNNINQKQYVGLTTRDVTERFEEHCKADSYIGKAIRKYGEGNFSLSILDTAESREELTRKEIDWISRLGTFGDGYNLTNGGDGMSLTKRIVVQLSKRQSKYCRWVEQENKKPLDVKDDSKMMVSVLINIVYLYLIADSEKDKVRAANMILRLKRNYLKEVAKLKVVDVQELLNYGK